MSTKLTTVKAILQLEAKKAERAHIESHSLCQRMLKTLAWYTSEIKKPASEQEVDLGINLTENYNSFHHELCEKNAAYSYHFNVCMGIDGDSLIQLLKDEGITKEEGIFESDELRDLLGELRDSIRSKCREFPLALSEVEEQYHSILTLYNSSFVADESHYSGNIPKIGAASAAPMSAFFRDGATSRDPSASHDPEKTSDLLLETEGEEVRDATATFG